MPGRSTEHGYGYGHEHGHRHRHRHRHGYRFVCVSDEQLPMWRYRRCNPVTASPGTVPRRPPSPIPAPTPSSQRKLGSPDRVATPANRHTPASAGATRGARSMPGRSAEDRQGYGYGYGYGYGQGYRFGSGYGSPPTNNYRRRGYRPDNPVTASQHSRPSLQPIAQAVLHHPNMPASDHDPSSPPPPQR